MTSTSGLNGLPLYGKWKLIANPKDAINHGIRFHRPFVNISAQTKIFARQVNFLAPTLTGMSVQNVRLQAPNVPDVIKVIATRPNGNIRSILNGWDAAQILHVNELNTFLNTSFRMNGMMSDIELNKFDPALLEAHPSQNQEDYFPCPSGNPAHGQACRIVEFCVALDTARAEFLPEDQDNKGIVSMAMALLVKPGSPAKVKLLIPAHVLFNCLRAVLRQCASWKVSHGVFYKGHSWKDIVYFKSL